MSKTKIILLCLSFIIWGMTSNILSFFIPVFVNSTRSTITSAQNLCSCTSEGQSNRCIIDDVFSSIEFFKEGNHADVYQNVTATVQPVLDTHIKTISHFEWFYDKCLLETNESGNDYLKYESTSHCSTFKCCVQCTGCPKNRILNDRGPLILKEEMNVCDFKTSQFTILLQCGTNDSHPVAGSHFFMLRVSPFHDVCTVMESISDAAPITINGITVNQNTLPRKAPTTSVFTPIKASRRLTLSLQPDIKRLQLASTTPVLRTELPFTSAVPEGTKETPPRHKHIATLNVLTNSCVMIVNTQHTDIKVKPFSDAGLMMPVVPIASGAAFVVLMCAGVNCFVFKWYKARSIAPR